MGLKSEVFGSHNTYTVSRNPKIAARGDVPLRALKWVLRRPVRRNCRTRRAGVPWSAVWGWLLRFVNFGLGEIAEND